MNVKAQKFKDYLDEKEIKVFEIEELPDDEQHTAAFRSRVTINGQSLPTIVLIDDSIFGLVRVLVSPKALNDDNQLDLLKLANEQTGKYKPFKLYFDANGDLLLDFCFIANDDDFNGQQVYDIYDVIISYLEQNYREFMKSIWK